jgi:hypothetical protein
MSEILILLCFIFLGFASGYVLRDYQRWNSEMNAYKRAQREQEPPNGEWNNERVNLQ